MPTAPNRPRNSRTANGLKKGLHIDWDTPKDADAYSDRERTAFRKVLARMQELEAEVAAYRDTEWDNHTNGAD